MSATDKARQRLQDALAAEHAAVYGYGVLGPHLAGGLQAAARDSETAHRDRRDALVVQLTAAGVTPRAAAPAYALPSPVKDGASAIQLALTLERRSAVVWGAGLPDLTGTDRTTALNALTDCAVRATGWRRAGGQSPATEPFPGRA